MAESKTDNLSPNALKVMNTILLRSSARANFAHWSDEQFLGACYELLNLNLAVIEQSEAGYRFIIRPEAAAALANQRTH